MTPTAARPPTPNAATSRATAFLEEHRDDAVALGRTLGDLVHDPTAFAAELSTGLEQLADREYQAGQQYVAPGLGPSYGVRNPLLTAATRSLLQSTHGVSSALLLDIVDRLLRHEVLEPRWFAFRMLEQTIRTDPERSWQLIRKAARDAGDWITVDSLAHPAARGILVQSFRWAEIEQLVFSSSKWERRLVGSTIATMPFVDRRAGRTAEYVQRGLALLAELIGDAEADVQKALAWAYRSVATVDPEAAAAALTEEARIAGDTGDGHRAWVIRDAATKLAPTDAARLRAQLRTVRRRSDAPPTSRASETATRFVAGT